MAEETLTLPDGETVTPEDVFLFEGYPYRFVPADEADVAFYLSPLYWGGGDMDVPFADREALAEQWGDASEGTLSAAEWESWLVEARADERFDDAELDHVRREVLGAGVLARLRRALGR
ncbi:MAG: hypothetical protein ABEJ70_00440 [Halobacteriaceae archaeon]